MSARRPGDSPPVRVERSKRAVIAEVLRARIADGTYGPGSKLPRQGEFAAEFGCSVTPVVRAFGEAEGSGLIRRVLDGRGNGFVVTAVAGREARAAGAGTPAGSTAGNGSTARRRT